MDQRSPKSETSTQDRYGAASGMGKKSNSTSQLSATGNLSKSLSISTFAVNFFFLIDISKTKKNINDNIL
jgi:hypothetical protein